jgi:hypothetical protein
VVVAPRKENRRSLLQPRGQVDNKEQAASQGKSPQPYLPVYVSWAKESTAPRSLEIVYRADKMPHTWPITFAHVMHQCYNMIVEKIFTRRKAHMPQICVSFLNVTDSRYLHYERRKSAGPRKYADFLRQARPRLYYYPQEPERTLLRKRESLLHDDS